MSPALAIDPAHLGLVRAILAEHLPQGISAGVFGSRADGTCKPWSDLDLVLEGSEALSLSLLAKLAEAFDEAALPWKVDIVDRRTVSDAFGRIIDRTRRDLG